MTASNIPDNIRDCVKIVKALKDKPHPNGEDKRRLALAHLQVAVWGCAMEKVPISRFALSQILGPETNFVFKHAEEEMIELPWTDQEDIKYNNQLIAARRGTKPVKESDKYKL
ncbi:hypothetical protein FACS1894139_07080 [Planctomycetales bacterium]|nr:hypothetical protein FACS1894107_04940 [Planctomycetales bacterium]GHT04628.1 hypothetical protein FACS1894139_07080 [Planctomycetales bacterium]GHV18400.1 hypothetical protein AGMMS49959_00060 [Planctomycetales bacterium]